MISFLCPSCQKKLSVKDELAGKKAKCPRCGHIEVVPAPVSVPRSVEDMQTVLPAPAQGKKPLPAPPEPHPPEPPIEGPTIVPPAQTGNANPPTLPPVGDPGDTLSNRDRIGVHDASLTEFLMPPQAKDELGRLGPYRILRILGHGGMGVVYQAEDMKLKRTVALKAMLPALAASAGAGLRFQREAESMAALEHDHIVRIYQVAEDRGVPFMAMEFLKGESLDDRLKRDGQLPVAEVVRIGREIAEALDAAHATGLIHRDIKPANIWLENRGEASGGRKLPGKSGDVAMSLNRDAYAPRLQCRVKILDFGLARAASQEAGLTQQGAIIGTPAFMSPEQARGENTDARCDLFSLGVVLYRMSSGQLPFRGKDTVSTLMEVAMHEPAAPIELNADVPRELSELIMRLLEKDPLRRPAVAAEVVHALRALETRLAQLQAPAAPAPEPLGQLASPPVSPPTPGSGGPRRKGPLIAAALAAVAALLAGIVFFWPTQGGTVRIEINDPDVEAVFTKNGPTFKLKDKQEIKVTPGEFGLHIKRGDLEFDTDKFILKNGDDITLRIEWFKEGKLQVVQGDKVIGLGEKPPPPIDVAVLPPPKVETAEPPSPKVVKADSPLIAPSPNTPPESANGLLFAFAKDRPQSAVVVPSLKLDREGPLTLEGYFTHLKEPGGFGIQDPLLGVSRQLRVCLHTKNWMARMESEKANFDAGGAPVVVGQPVHVACVRTAKDVRLYVNGKLVGKNSAVGLTGPNPLSQTKNDFLLGGYSPFDGIIGEVRVSSIARYDQDFTPQKRFEADKDTIALYHFDEGSGDKLIDSSGNGHHGNIVGAKWVKAAGAPLPPPPSAAPFIALFNGKDLTGWVTDKGDVSDWKVVDGALTCTGVRSHLFTTRDDFANFHLRVEAKINNGGNSGIYFRAQKNAPWPIGYEAQIALDGDAYGTGSLHGLAKAADDLVAADKWFTMEVIAVGPRIRILVDGKEVVNHVDATPKARAWGQIALQQNGKATKVSFRKIEIQPLSADGAPVGALPTAFAPLDPDFLKRVAELKAPEQIDAVKAELMRRNQGFDGKIESYKTDKAGTVTDLKFSIDNVTDISPVRALAALKRLDIAGSGAWEQKQGKLTDLTPLKGMKLVHLYISGTPLTELPSFLKEMPLTNLSCAGMPVSDLAPLKGMNLVYLDCRYTKVADLTPLKGMTKLVSVNCVCTPVSDLSPLKGAAKLTFLHCAGSEVVELSLLKGMPLTDVSCDLKSPRDLELLRSITTLKKINNKTAEAFWKEMAVRQAAFDAWVKRVAAQPAEEQVKEVADKLRELNPDFDGKIGHKTDKAGAVTELTFFTDNVTDISPVRALAELRTLKCGSSMAARGKLADLTPLKNMKLTQLECAGTAVSDLTPLEGMRLTTLFLQNTQVADLKPLKDMKLTTLSCGHAKVTDLSPLRGMPLKTLGCDFKPFRDARLLRSLTTLEKINNKDAKLFWKGVDAQQAVFDAWASKVATLPAKDQIEEVKAELMKRNPEFDGKIGNQKITGGVVTELGFAAAKVTDIAPVRALTGLQKLRCAGTTGLKGQLADLSPLYGTNLTFLDCSFTLVADLSPLKDLKLTILWIQGTKVADLTLLKDMKLTELHCGNTSISDLTPLKDMQLNRLDLVAAPVSDLSPLKGMPLAYLGVHFTRVEDLMPLKGMPLTSLRCEKANVADLSPLKGMPLKEITCDFRAQRDAELLRSITTLQKINTQDAKQFLK